jgi:hypothetical protein
MTLMNQTSLLFGTATVLLSGIMGCSSSDPTIPDVPRGQGGAGGTDLTTSATGMGGIGGAGGDGGAGGAGGEGGSPPDYTGNPTWSRGFNGETDQRIRAVAAGADGSVLITGEFSGTIDLGSGPLMSEGGTDLFVAKLDPSGQLLWSLRAGDATDQRGQGIAVDAAGNVLVSGMFEGTMDLGGTTLTSAGSKDVFVAKLDPLGQPLWGKSFGDAADQLAPGGTPGVMDVAVDDSGNVLLVGTFYGTMDLGGGPLPSEVMDGPGVLVAKLDPSGEHTWSKRFGGMESWQYARDLAISTDGVFLTGSFIGALDFGGGALTSAIGAEDGGGGPDDPSVDGFLVKLNADGEHVWSVSLGDKGQQYSKYVEVDAAGDAVIAGSYFSGFELGGTTVEGVAGPDLFLARFNGDSGEATWVKPLPGAGEEYVYGLGVDPWGNLNVTGYFTEALDFGAGALTSMSPVGDLYVAKLDAQGDHIWSKSFTNQYFVHSTAMAVGADSTLVISGLFYNDPADPGGGYPVTLGGDALDHTPGPYNADAFLVKLAP